MASFPLIVTTRGQYAMLLVPADSESTMDQVAAIQAGLAAGIPVGERPDAIRRLTRMGQDKPFARDLKIKDSGLKPMEWLELYCE